MKIKPKNLLGMIMTIILIFSSSAILYRNIIVTVEENLGLTIQELKQKEFETIWSHLEDFHEHARQEVDIIASNIEDDILSLPEDKLEQLHSDMDNDIINQDFHNILNSNIENYNFNGIDNHQNGVIIMNMKGYVEDFNYRRASECSITDEAHSCREWSCSIENAYNQELEKDAVDKLLNRTTGIIATESYNITHNNNHIMIEELTYDALLNVYLEEGLNGLRNYQIFVPHYITNVGDIFGTPDINHGVKLENHKIIVVMEFNLYDQLTNGYLNDDVNTDSLTYRYDTLLRELYIFGLVIMVTVVVLILYLCSVYNDLILHEMINNPEEKSEDIEL